MSGSLPSMVADRIAGLQYRQIAEKHGTSVPMVRTHLRRAMLQGLVSAEAIRYKPAKPRERTPDGEYNAKWISKILTNVEIDAAGCWLWKGFRTEWGYAQAPYRGTNKTVHRQMYQVVNNVKLTRWELVMHKCDVPHCVNPAHLVLGTPHDNVQDAANKGRHHNARKTHCKRGHELAGDNLFVCSSGLRHCKVCHRGRQRVKAGWPEHLAYSVDAIPAGQRTERRTYKRKTA